MEKHANGYLNAIKHENKYYRAYNHYARKIYERCQNNNNKMEERERRDVEPRTSISDDQTANTLLFISVYAT